jgi:hypothetical protein
MSSSSSSLGSTSECESVSDYQNVVFQGDDRDDEWFVDED